MRNCQDDRDPSFLDRSIWAEPLFKFAQVSGLVISLYDKQGKRWCGPCFNHALAARLARDGIWEEGGWGFLREQQLVQRCVLQEKPIHETILDVLGLLAVPCRHEGELVFVFVLGWMHHVAPESSVLKTLAAQLHLPWEEAWQLLRSMAPISEERLRAHGQMLDIFSSSLLRQWMLQTQNLQQRQAWKLLSDAAFALAGATREHEICQIAHLALRELLSHAHGVIKLIPAHGPWGAMAVYEDEDRFVLSMIPHVRSVRRHINLPIMGRRDELLGFIDLTFEYGVAIEFHLDMLYALAEQLGMALQKARWISRLEDDSRAFEGAHLELGRLHRAKDDFLAAVSHELKMPLSTIMGWAQIPSEEGQGAENGQEALPMLERKARPQSRLIEDLLDISRIISGKMSLQREKQDVVGILQQTLEALMPAFQIRGQSLQRNISTHPLRLWVDSVRLQQVFWNLLSNASKFTADGGLIQVTLQSDGPCIRFEVTDSGQGIASPDVERLFFCFQGNSPRPAQEPCGLGLGLAIVKHLVEMHGGSVAVKSEGLGHGATFTVLLPLAAAEGEPPRIRAGKPLA
jgi:signal transduction histidine kinase